MVLAPHDSNIINSPSLFFCLIFFFSFFTFSPASESIKQGKLMASTGLDEKPKKGGIYVYKLDTGSLKPTPESDPSVKKAILRGWGLRRSKTTREVDHGRMVNKVEEGVSVKEIVEARKSVSSESRKSVSHLEVNVASVAAFLQVKVLVTDMPGFMQVHAFRCARRTYDSLEKFSSKHLAYNMKKEFDKVYGPAWHCIVGSSFGSFVTHSTGCFLYFAMEKLYILVFKTKIQRALHS